MRVRDQDRAVAADGTGRLRRIIEKAEYAVNAGVNSGGDEAGEMGRRRTFALDTAGGPE